MAVRTQIVVTDVQQTVVLVTVTCGSYTTTAGRAYQFEAHVLGRDTTTGDVFECVRYGGARNIATVLTLVGAVRTLTDNVDASLAACVVTADASGEGIRIRCTGIALQTVEWMTWLTIRTN